MSQGRIDVRGLTKEYRGVIAVDDLSFTVEPGRVTGFLGPNGAGKTTTLRMLLGLVEPTAGTATIGGVRYADLDQPIRRVGAILEAGAAHKDRTGRDHLRIVCQSAGIPLARSDEVLELVGLGAAGNRTFRGYSLGMRQRLGVAAELLGNPQVLILDERQRAGPRGHQVDARPAQDPGCAGPDDPGVQPPARGDGTARRQPGPHYGRTADRPGTVASVIGSLPYLSAPWCALPSWKSSRPRSAATRP